MIPADQDAFVLWARAQDALQEVYRAEDPITVSLKRVWHFGGKEYESYLAASEALRTEASKSLRQQQVIDARAMRRSGFTLHEIADTFGVSCSTAYNWVRNVRTCIKPPENYEDLLKRVAGKGTLTMKEAAAIVGCSTTRIRDWSACFSWKKIKGRILLDAADFARFLDQNKLLWTKG